MTPARDWLPALLDSIPLHVWIAVVVVVLAQRLVARLGMWPYALVALPGTLAHELSHWLVATLLFARPRFPDLWPRRSETGWRLGSVSFVAPWWRAAPIAIAPLALLPAALLWMAELTTPAQGAAFVLHAWIAGTLLTASLPSRADWRLALPALAIAAVAAAAWLLIDLQ